MTHVTTVVLIKNVYRIFSFRSLGQLLVQNCIHFYYIQNCLQCFYNAQTIQSRKINLRCVSMLNSLEVSLLFNVSRKSLRISIKFSFAFFIVTHLYFETFSLYRIKLCFLYNRVKQKFRLTLGIKIWSKTWNDEDLLIF